VTVAEAQGYEENAQTTLDRMIGMHNVPIILSAYPTTSA
jgi:hypothetical protein